MATQLIKVTKKDGKEVNYELTPAAKVAFESQLRISVKVIYGGSRII
jgi:hypothetical protein